MSGDEPRIELRPRPNGFWHWTYVGAETLPSNLEYATREQARSSARNAYPDLPLDEPPQDVDVRPREEGRLFALLRRLWTAALLGVILVHLARRVLGVRPSGGPRHTGRAR